MSETAKLIERLGRLHGELCDEIGVGETVYGDAHDELDRIERENADLRAALQAGLDEVRRANAAEAEAMATVKRTTGIAQDSVAGHKPRCKCGMCWMATEILGKEERWQR